MNVILFDDDKRTRFLPLTYTRPVAELLTGMFSLRRRWERTLETETSTLTESYLQALYPLKVENDNLLINARVLPNRDLVQEIKKLRTGEKLVAGEVVVAMHVGKQELESTLKEASTSSKLSRFQLDRRLELLPVKSIFHLHDISRPWHLFTMSAQSFQSDLDLLDKHGFKSKLSDDNRLFGDELFVHKDAKVRASVINTETGPVVIDEGAEIMEGSLIRGPVYIGKGSTVKMGAKIYGPVSLGEQVKIGGEVSSSIVHSFSNKGHDGFIGQTVIGEWCNLGADTNTSNLKNDYGLVKLWDYETGDFRNSEEQFLGLIMGDHSKCSINSMFNTGTVVGAFCNVFGSGFPAKFIPSFTWGAAESMAKFRPEKAAEVAGRMMERRQMGFGPQHMNMMQTVYDLTEKWREKFH